MSRHLNSQFVIASVNEFINVWALGGSASLSLTTKDGQATVEFNCTLGNPGAPHCLPTSLPSSPPRRQPRHRGPAEKERNRQRAARHQAARATASGASSSPVTAPVTLPSPSSTESVLELVLDQPEQVQEQQEILLDQPELVQEQQEVLLDTSVSNTVMAEDAKTETLNKEIYTEVIPQLDGPAEPRFSDQLPVICDYCDYKNCSKDIMKEHMKKHKNHRTRSPPRRPRRSSPPRWSGR